MLPLNGIDRDCVYLDELCGAGRTILDFDTLRAFDEAAYGFQEQELKADDPSYGGKPYRGSLYLTEARLHVDARLTYATLSMAAGYIYTCLCDAGRTVLESLVPHHYVYGRNHGKVEGRYCRWDIRVCADGKEGVLEELQCRMWSYEKERFDALLTRWDTDCRSCIYLVGSSDLPDAKVHIVFSDKHVLSKVNCRSFVADCRAVEKPLVELERAVAGEVVLLTKFLEDQHAQVIRTFDPRVVRFRDKRRILVGRSCH